MDEFYKCISVRLFDVMEHVGASENMRLLHQSTAIQMEISWAVMDHMEDINAMSDYIFGSFMEGTTSPDIRSDIDVLNCLDMHPVHENIADVRAGLSSLIVRDAHTRPGYVKLQDVQDGVPLTVCNLCNWDINHRVDSDCDGKICSKHFIDENADERNGPANTHLRYSAIPPIDLVAAYRCSSIPRFAVEWSTLRRKYNWPSRFMLDSMTSSGCFVVGVGHPASDEQHIEWRLSFSLQEREMMLSFNPTQHKCYILLKYVKKDIIVRTLGKCLSSYHMKTCMFYLIQNTRPGTWTPANLFLCLNLCLNVLLKWVKCGYCPNYFIKEENMFDRDVHRQVKQRLSFLLDTLIQAGPRILLSIGCDNINQYLIHPERLPDYIADVEMQRNMLLTLMNLVEMNFRFTLLSCCKKKINGTSECLFLSKQFQFVKKALLLKRKPYNYCRQTLTQFVTYIYSRLGTSYMSLALGAHEPAINHWILNMAQISFNQERNCDMTSSRLMHASVLYMVGQYERCVRLLEKIDAEIGHYVVSSCSCRYVKYEGDPKQRPLTYANTASCVVFLPSNRNITPAPLVPEMYRSVDTPPGSRDETKDFWFDCAAVDGKVYLHFLKYLAYNKLDQQERKEVAMLKLMLVMIFDPNLGHIETALNLLGWIQVHENSIVDGIRWFIMSWKKRPIHNAAKWHLGIAVHKHLHAIQNKTQ